MQSLTPLVLLVLVNKSGALDHALWSLGTAEALEEDELLGCWRFVVRAVPPVTRSLVVVL